MSERECNGTAIRAARSEQTEDGRTGGEEGSGGGPVFARPRPAVVATNEAIPQSSCERVVWTCAWEGPALCAENPHELSTSLIDSRPSSPSTTTTTLAPRSSPSPRLLAHEVTHGSRPQDIHQAREIRCHEGNIHSRTAHAHSCEPHRVAPHHSRRLNPAHTHSEVSRTLTHASPTYECTMQEQHLRGKKKRIAQKGCLVWLRARSAASCFRYDTESRAGRSDRWT